MTIKNYKYTTIFTALFLTGCGGGDTSIGNTTHSTKDFDTLYQVYYQEASTHLTLNKDFFGLSSYPINNKQIHFPDNDKMLEQYVITQTSVFQPSEKRQSYLSIDSDDNWTYHYLPNIKLHLKVKKIDLSQQNIFDRMRPGLRANFTFPGTITSDTMHVNNFKLFDLHGKKSFPQNSSCYQVVETRWSQDFIQFDDPKTALLTYFDPDHEHFNQSRQQEQQYQENAASNGQLYEQFIEGIWQNTEWFASIKTSPGKFDYHTSHIYYAKYDNPAIFYSSKVWTQEQELISNPYQQVNPDDDQMLQYLTRLGNAYRVELQDGCFVYNQTAYNAIRDLNDIDFRIFESPKSSFFFGKRSYGTDSQGNVEIE